ncbi:MAG: pilus assembly FimT family protein [Leptodesmis sp.]|uniref:pilus assembly FimT family protein n=1 Tax=Leptodesmis sp. TaxID=3100501 RepID=UPI003D140156
MKKAIGRRGLWGRSHKLTRSQGFTLLEIAIVIVLIGILFTIAAASWSVFLNIYRLNTAQEQVFLAMRTAQTSAKQQHLSWQADFRQVNQMVQWAIHPDGSTSPEAQWHSLDPNVRLDPETTLRKTGNVWRIEFNHLGRVNGQLGRITLSGKQGGRVKRCVIVSTLLGALQKGANQATPKDGKYCY